MQASKRGLGRDELRYVMPEFLAAVRWASFVEQLGPDLVSARARAEADPPQELLTEGGPELIAFNARRRAARDRVAELDPVLYPPDPEPDDE